MFEVKAGQLAADKATSPDVKQFGQKMVTDHTALNDEMKPIAEKMGVTPSDQLDSKDQASYDKLSGLSGQDFDKEYLRMMVMDHRKDQREFKHEAQSTSDPQLKQAVTKGEKVIAEHLHMVTALAKKNGAGTGAMSGGMTQ
jgi:putative membrane protein